MKTLRRHFVIILCLGLSVQALAQTQATVDTLPTRSKSFLRVGVHIPLGRASTGQQYRFDLTYERVLSQRLTASANLTSYNRFGPGFSPDVVNNSGGSRSYHDILLGLSLDLKYYLSKNKYSGHYLSLEVKDVLAYTRYSTSSFIDVLGYNDRSVASLPRVGIYYGYRKQFDGGLFIDGRIGYAPDQQFTNISSFDSKNFDFKLSLGYTIPFRNKKKK